MKFAGIVFLVAGFAAPAISADLCNGNTYRCWQWDNCAINGKVQPCAYGSSSATSGALTFSHGAFAIDWDTPEKMSVTYGEKNEFTSNGDAFTNSSGVMIVLEDGTNLFYPGDRD